MDTGRQALAKCSLAKAQLMGKYDFLLAVDAWKSVHFFIYFLLCCGIWGNLEHLSAFHVVLISLYKPVLGEELGLWGETKLSLTLSFPLTSCVTMDTSLNLSEARFAHSVKISPFGGLFWCVNETTYVKCLYSSRQLGHCICFPFTTLFFFFFLMNERII